jgi:hypothetical protein
VQEANLTYENPGKKITALLADTKLQAEFKLASLPAQNRLIRQLSG